VKPTLTKHGISTELYRHALNGFKTWHQFWPNTAYQWRCNVMRRRGSKRRNDSGQTRHFHGVVTVCAKTEEEWILATLRQRGHNAVLLQARKRDTGGEGKALPQRQYSIVFKGFSVTENCLGPKTLSSCCHNAVFGCNVVIPPCDGV
jgi:hypothetical protein